MKKTILAIVGCLLGAAVMFLPLPGLVPEGRRGLGILVWAISWWVFKILPDFVTALLMGAAFILLCKIPGKTMLTAFSESSVWLLFSSYALSMGLGRSGLLHRVSLYVLKIFPRSFQGQTLGLITAGTVLGPFIPNLSAKAAILAPLSLGLSDSMAYERKGTQANGLFLAMLTGLRTPAPLFISASVLGYAFIGLYPPEIAVKYTMARWFLTALPWFLMVSTANYLAIILLYKPKAEIRQSKEKTQQQLLDLGPMSKHEKCMLALMLVTMTLWATEEIHGVPAYVVSIIAMCIMLFSGVLSVEEFSSKMNWGPLIYIGVVLGIAPVFSLLGINDWLVGFMGPVLSAVSASPWLLLVCIGLVTILLRFIVASELATVNIIMVFLIPLSVSLGINPWVTGFAVYSVVCPWFFMYQNPVYMAAYYAVNGEMATQSSAACYCGIYLFISLAALVLTIPIWISRGVFFL